MGLSEDSVPQNYWDWDYATLNRTKTHGGVIQHMIWVHDQQNLSSDGLVLSSRLHLFCIQQAHDDAVFFPRTCLSRWPLPPTRNQVDAEINRISCGGVQNWG